MRKVTLGNTGITVNKNGFGALPIQRTPRKRAVALLQKAFEKGVDFYDTARFYSDSEENWAWLLEMCANRFFSPPKRWLRRRMDSGGIWRKLLEI